MNNKEKCEIIKDLLPNYVDNLISEETKKFIESHLKECKECNKTYENMKKHIEKENQNLKKEVKYAKKYNRKIKILLFIIFFILLTIFSLTFVRNAIIINSLSKKAKQYENCDNYHMTWSTYSKDETTIFEVFYKNGKYLEKIYNFNYEENSLYNYDLSNKVMFYYGGDNKLVTYNENQKIIIYDEIDEDNFQKNSPLPPASMTHITMYTENPIQFILSCFTNQISLEKCNGIRCYRLKRYFDDTGALYVDKNTGISVRGESGVISNNNYRDTFSDVSYELNTVNDEDVKMPSTEGYILEKR